MFRSLSNSNPQVLKCFSFRGVRRQMLGFTLIELLISLALLGVVLLYAFSFTASFENKNRVQVLADEVSGAIRYARTEALLRGESLILTQSSNGSSWSEGMVLFVDDGTHRYTPGVKLLHEWRWTSKGIVMAWHGFNSEKYLLFSSKLGKNTINGRFEIRSSVHQKISLIVNRWGRVRVSQEG